MRIVLIVAAVGAGAVLAVAAGGHGSDRRLANPPIRVVAPRPEPKPKPPPVRPPQFVVVGFDGAGGAQMWRYWLRAARRAHAQFTFFVSGVYLIDWAHSTRYRPPHHPPGTSAIGFGQASGDLTVRNTAHGIAAGYRAHQEIGTHFNGHFCAPDPGSVGNWTAADWQSELRQFDTFLFGAGRRLGTGRGLGFGPRAIVGARTPCLEGSPKVLYPVLARDGFRYDASQQAPPGAWPHRQLGIWSIPLLELPMAGHTFRVVSMDYNFLANQVDESPEQAETEMYRTLWNAFRASYHGRRAPLTIGQHFETWKSWAYDRALARFLTRACRLPEVRCTGYRRLADFLDSVPAWRMRRYRAGRFPPLASPRASLNRR